MKKKILASALVAVTLSTAVTPLAAFADTASPINSNIATTYNQPYMSPNVGQGAAVGKVLEKTSGYVSIRMTKSQVDALFYIGGTIVGLASGEAAPALSFIIGAIGYNVSRVNYKYVELSFNYKTHKFYGIHVVR
ncbi:MAG: hypothetical protein ABF913_07180 [Oenococcus sp.]|uniref:hypothetical protein n=1 Tax=Oenococcus sp. TaxID=1979414 RepID=UPI0039EB93D6